MMQMNLFIKQKQTHRLQKLMVTKGERDGLGVWDGQYALLYMEWRRVKGTCCTAQ